MQFVLLLELLDQDVSGFCRSTRIARNLMSLRKGAMFKVDFVSESQQHSLAESCP